MRLSYTPSLEFSARAATYIPASRSETEDLIAKAHSTTSPDAQRLSDQKVPACVASCQYALAMPMRYLAATLDRSILLTDPSRA